MRRKIVLFFIIIICYVLQTTVFHAISFANIVPNLMIIIVSSFGFMRGGKEGMWVGFFCGLIMDIFSGFYIGVFALLYMYVGFLNGFFQKKFFPDDIKLPLLLISGSDVLSNVVIYIVMFLLRGRFKFWFYLKSIIIPELIYTLIISIFLYVILLKINQLIEISEKRSAKKFDL